MDVHSLAVVLQAALSPSHDERKAAEQSLNQVSLYIHVFLYLYICVWGDLVKSGVS